MESIQRVIGGGSLSRKSAYKAMEALFSESLSEQEIKDFLLALKMRGESSSEIAGFADYLRKKSKKLSLKRKDVIDNCGTGGDGAGTYNISTAAAFIVAAADGAVAKHGNRSVSSRCGSADVLEALEVPIHLEAKKLKNSIDQLGFGFIFAPDYNPIMGRVAQIRKSLGVRTVFNLLGPLLNPAFVERQVLGVYDVTLVEVLAKVLRSLGTREAYVIGSRDGLDEISLEDKTLMAHLKNGKISLQEICPEDFDLKRASRSELQGGSAKENAEILLGLFEGKIRGAKREALVLNAAPSLVLSKKAKNFPEAIKLAQDLLNKGNVLESLERVRAYR